MTDETPIRIADREDPDLPRCDPMPASDGRHPLAALPGMLVGVVCAAVAAYALAAAMMGLIGLLYGCLHVAHPYLMRLWELTGRVGDFFVLAMLAFFGFGGIIFGVALVLPRFCRLSRNRSALLAFGYGLLAGFIAAVAVKMSVVLGFEPNAPAVREVGLWRAMKFSMGVNGVDLTLTILWIAVTTLFSGVLGFAGIADDPYCQRCVRYMPQSAQWRPTRGALVQSVKAINRRAFREAADLLADDRREAQRDPKSPPAKRAGEVVAHQCPACGEALVTARSIVKNAEVEKTIIVASTRLTPGEAKAAGKLVVFEL